MIVDVITPTYPIIENGVPLPIVRYALAAFEDEWRPMINSHTMPGIPRNITQPIYINMNAAPPLWPVIYGKRQILPRPTAEPAVANITPNLLPKFTLLL